MLDIDKGSSIHVSFIYITGSNKDSDWLTQIWSLTSDFLNLPNLEDDLYQWWTSWKSHGHEFHLSTTRDLGEEFFGDPMMISPIVY